MVENIEYKYINAKELNGMQSEIVEFLLNLGPERKTLFEDTEIDEEKYSERIKKQVKHINYAIIALHKEKIVGLSTDMKKGKGLIGKIYPVSRGYIVVSEDFQGKGIGSKLSKIKTQYIEKTWGFRVGKHKIENTRVFNIGKKSGNIIIGTDDKFRYSFRPTRSELKIFNPIIYLLCRLYFIEFPRLRRLFIREK